jgi:hypothetical protein
MTIGSHAIRSLLEIRGLNGSEAEWAVVVGVDAPMTALQTIAVGGQADDYSVEHCCR